VSFKEINQALQCRRMQSAISYQTPMLMLSAAQQRFYPVAEPCNT